MNLYLDIESLPGAEKPKLEDISAPKNYKDEEKILAYKEDKLEEEYRKQALDSMKGRVLCIGYQFEDSPFEEQAPEVIYEVTEKETIKRFNDLLMNMRPMFFIGHNILEFDLTWIWRKLIQYEFYDAARMIPRKKFDDRVQDTMLIWAGPNFKDKVSLDSLAKFLGIESKKEGMDGSQVYDMWLQGRHEEIKEYCKDDVRIVREIYKRIGA